MVRPKFTRAGRRGIDNYHIFNLVVGRSFFAGYGFGNDLDAMREAWADPSVRERVRQESQRRYSCLPFAEFCFDDGLELEEAREAFRQARAATRAV
ncbi:MAG: hypothetical protein HQ526_11500 [Actinobacteria bacterium]|nr:hypothetical protein [Actinomycetota bacterium]